MQMKTAAYFVMLVSVAFSEPSKDIGRIDVDGEARTLFYEEKNGKPAKYFLDARGKRVELAAHQKAELRRKREKYGIYGAGLHRELSAFASNDSLDVEIAFRRATVQGSLAGGKLTRAEAESQAVESFQDGMEELERKIGRLSSEKSAFQGRNGLRIKLRKADVLALGNSRRIASISLPGDRRKERVIKQAKLEESFVGTGWNSGGLHYPDDCGDDPECGSGVLVGVLEGQPISNTDSALYLDGTWFRKRPGTPISVRDPHALWITSIIHNAAPGGGPSRFDSGGAYQSIVSLGYPVEPVGTMEDAYEWLHSDQYVSIVNHSWQFPPLYGGGL